VAVVGTLATLGQVPLVVVVALAVCARTYLTVSLWLLVHIQSLWVLVGPQQATLLLVMAGIRLLSV
jgi:hypothetical protein